MKREYHEYRTKMIEQEYYVEFMKFLEEAKGKTPDEVYKQLSQYLRKLNLANHFNVY